MATRDTDLKSRVMLMLQEQGYVLFRNNTGKANVARAGQPPRWVRYGLIKGSSDLIGYLGAWTGDGPRSIFTAVECKSVNDRLTPEQKTFLRNVRESGGIAMIAKEQKDGSIKMEDYTG